MNQVNKALTEAVPFILVALPCLALLSFQKVGEKAGQQSLRTSGSFCLRCGVEDLHPIRFIDKDGGVCTVCMRLPGGEVQDLTGTLKVLLSESHGK